MIPDGTLIKLIRAPGDTAALWRLGLTSLVGFVMQSLQYGRMLPRMVYRLGPWGALVGVMGGFSNMLFILAVKQTTVANVLLIMATSSFWVALLCRVVLGIEIQPRTWAAMPFVFSGVALTLSSGLSTGAGFFNDGDLLALAIAVLGAVRRTILRSHSGIDMLPALPLGNMFFCLVLALWGTSPKLCPEDL